MSMEWHGYVCIRKHYCLNDWIPSAFALDCWHYSCNPALFCWSHMLVWSYYIWLYSEALKHSVLSRRHQTQPTLLFLWVFGIQIFRIFISWLTCGLTSLSCRSRRRVLFLLMWRLRNRTATPRARITNASRPPTTPAAIMGNPELQMKGTLLSFSCSWRWSTHLYFLFWT